MQASMPESYSPRIVSTIFINEASINIRELSTDTISVETDRHFPPCDATIQTIVGDEMDEIRVRLLDGIDPSRDDQPIRILSDI